MTDGCVGQRVERLQLVQDQMVSAATAGARVHFELASFTDETLLHDLTERLLPHAHSLGMNEQVSIFYMPLVTDNSNYC